MAVIDSQSCLPFGSANWATVGLKTSQRSSLSEPIHWARLAIIIWLSLVSLVICQREPDETLETVLKTPTDCHGISVTKGIAQANRRIQVPVRIRFLERFIAVRSFAIQSGSVCLALQCSNEVQCIVVWAIRRDSRWRQSNSRSLDVLV